jgi:hypothetical protein
MNVSKNGYLRIISATIGIASSVVMLACSGDPAPGPDPTTPATGASRITVGK